MKSNKEALLERGFADIGIELFCAGLNFKSKISLLESNIPFERTLGARLLRKDKDENTIPLLIKTLKKENKLYPKIEICNTLASFGFSAVKPLINELGKIGNNQHITVPLEKFKKKSYPLPRDIISRTLASMGITALPELLTTLRTAKDEQLCEALDSIGYICFYNPQKNVFQKLKACFLGHKENEIIRWKVIRAMSGIPESKSFLLELLNQETHKEGIELEIQRSLSLLNS